MQRRPALVVCLVHSSTLLHQEAYHLQVLIYAGLRMGTGPSALLSPEAQQGNIPTKAPGPRRGVESNADGLWHGFQGSSSHQLLKMVPFVTHAWVTCTCRAHGDEEQAPKGRLKSGHGRGGAAIPACDCRTYSMKWGSPRVQPSQGQGILGRHTPGILFWGNPGPRSLIKSIPRLGSGKHSPSTVFHPQHRKKNHPKETHMQHISETE